MADVAHTRTLALAGHRGAGKTTLIERILFETKTIDRMGVVEAGTAHSDYLDEDKNHGCTTSLKFLHAEDQKFRLHLLDIPGDPDLAGELVSGLRAADASIIVVDGQSGLAFGAVRGWRRSENIALPRCIYVSKLDKEHADFTAVLAQIQERFGDKCVPITLPIGTAENFSGVYNLLKGGDVPDGIQGDAQSLREQLIERAAEADDELTEKFLEEGELSAEEIARGLKEGLINGTLVPVFAGASTSGIGVRELIDFIKTSMPAPNDRPPAALVDGGEVTADPSGPFAGLVIKSAQDPILGHLTILRVLSGTLKADTGFTNVTKGEKERIGHLLLLKGKEQVHVDSAGPGDVCAVAKLKHTEVSDTIASDGFSGTFRPIAFPDPMVRQAIEPVSRADEDKIMTALHRLVAEDATLHVERNRETKEDVIVGMGVTHLNLAVERLHTRYKVEATLHPPKIAYKEALKKPASARYRHKKQSGGKGQFGEVELEISPLQRGAGFEFINEIKGGAVSGSFIPAVEKGVLDRMKRGIIAGYPIVDVKCRLYDGNEHSVDSSEMAFKLAGSHAFRKACESSTVCLLEPVMDVAVVVPDEFMGDINSMLSTKRGRIQGMDPSPYGQRIKAQVPEAEMIGFSAELRSHTGGQGNFSMTFSHYDEVPGDVAKKIIDHAHIEEEED